MTVESCKYEDKIIEMYGLIKASTADIKWLCADSKRRNGIMETHVAESYDFRRQVDRNTIWRHVYKAVILALFGCIGTLWYYFFECLK